MAYRNYYMLLEARKIKQILLPHLNEGKSLKRLWSNYLLPVWPVSYRTFCKRINERNIEQRLAAIEEAERSKHEKKHQLKINYEKQDKPMD